jgi:hypothetical protein
MRRAVVLLGLVTACAHSEGGGDTPADAGGAGACAEAGSPPSTIACTGLYADLASKTIAPGVLEYAPAASLWADGAEKTRWIELPDGGVIDDTDPSEWTFPVGTKLWKEFRAGGRRLETRMFQKVRSNHWVHAAYVWNDDESDATQSFGVDLPGATGTPHHVPTPEECDQCHRGRTDEVLGFDAVGIGLPGATGVTLSDLVAAGRISPAPARAALSLGDDGTGRAGPALAWLHANCGAPCHNANSNSAAYGAGMRLRLDPTQLDGRNATSFEAETTTVGVGATSPSWSGVLRIAPGDPANSLIVQLARLRGDTDQMPPIATSLVDEADVGAIAAWISAMAPAAIADGGADAEPDGATDAEADAGDDGGEPDADAASDADARPDSGRDAAPDAHEDSGVDSGKDAEADATLEGDGGAGKDAASDASKDAAHRD